LVAGGLLFELIAIHLTGFCFKFEHHAIGLDLLRFLCTTSANVVVEVALRTLCDRRQNGWNGAGRIAYTDFKWCRHLPIASQHLSVIFLACIGTPETPGQHFVSGALIDKDQIVGILLCAKYAALLGNWGSALGWR